MKSMYHLFDQTNNEARDPSHSFKGWGSESSDFISEPAATSDFTGKAEDSVDFTNKKLVTPGPTKAAKPAFIPQFLSGGKTKVTPTSQL